MQKEAREKIKKLVEKYEKAKNSGILKSYSEEETKRGFIEPLFEILGWDIGNKKEVSLEETISSKRVDYGFYLNERIKFYLEAKKFNVDIHDEKFVNQAIRYSFNKGATWAVLTNFETLILFNAQDISKNLSDKRFFTINYNEYLEKFNQLSLLSKKAFEKDLLDREADKYGKKIERVPISSLLYKDLQKCREILINDLSKWNKDVNSDDLDEGVQKILDRLLFIRVAEDREVEPATLRPLVREYYSKERKETLYKLMIEKFRELDAFYNSNLFSKHPFENWEEFSGATKDVIGILYGKEGYYEYDFKAMPSDVLGTVYENYLSHRLSKSKKGTTVSKNASKRKEQGIYYTPSYIVDYIVKNALGPVLDKCKSVLDIKKIRVLDPACGSGSFLIKAVDIITEKYRSFGYKDEELLKRQIIDENIYGVDLDSQAVEITRLNLLINALTERTKFSPLKNIKNGNSLISGTDEELEKYFGKNFKDKKPFNWQEEFPEVFKQGGFDVIIGNPPWVSLKGKHKSIDVSDEEIKYFSDHYKSNTYAPNLYEIFIWKCLSLIVEDGILGFIVPDRILANEQYKELRKELLEKFTIHKLWSKVNFPGVIADAVIFVAQKNNSSNNIIEFLEYPNEKPIKIKQNFYLSKENNNIFYADNNLLDINKKLSSNKNIFPLIEFAKTTSGCGAKNSYIHKTQESANEIRIIKGENIGRYQSKSFLWFDFKDENLSGRTRDINKLGAKEKILLRKTGIDLIATFDDSGIYPEQSLYFIYGTNIDKLLYLLGLINSKFMNFYYQNFYITNMNSTPQLKNIDLDRFSIPKVSGNESKNTVSLVRKILGLNKDLQKITENSEKWNSIKSEIEKTDKKIDQEVYKLYELTDEEIKIVEMDK